IRLRANQLESLRAAIGRVAPGLDARTFLQLAADPAEATEAVSRLIDEVTIKETFFFRDRLQLETIDWHGLREVAHGVVRVWVAGCATGDEAYTVALLACKAFATPAPPVTIL